MKTKRRSGFPFNATMAFLDPDGKSPVGVEVSIALVIIQKIESKNDLCRSD